VPEIQPARLIDQAEYLALFGSGSGVARRPRDVDLRRAVSGAYYAVFHDLTALCVKELAGEPYVPLRRKLQHAQVEQVCKWVDRAGSAGPQELRSMFERLAESKRVAEFATNFIELIGHRHAADYDHDKVLTRNEAVEVIALAKAARVAIARMRKEDRRLFMTLLVMAREGR
jgi:uncharacterized protein (UPF0332 family)